MKVLDLIKHLPNEGGFWVGEHESRAAQARLHVHSVAAFSPPLPIFFCVWLPNPVYIVCDFFAFLKELSVVERVFRKGCLPLGRDPCFGFGRSMGLD